MPASFHHLEAHSMSLNLCNACPCETGSGTDPPSHLQIAAMLQPCVMPSCTLSSVIAVAAFHVGSSCHGSFKRFVQTRSGLVPFSYRPIGRSARQRRSCRIMSAYRHGPEIVRSIRLKEDLVVLLAVPVSNGLDELARIAVLHCCAIDRTVRVGDAEFVMALAWELGPRRPEGTDMDKDVRLQQIWELLSLELLFLSGSSLGICWYPVAVRSVSGKSKYCPRRSPPIWPIDDSFSVSGPVRCNEIPIAQGWH